LINALDPKLLENARNLLLSFVKKHGVNIVSDGDLDGILASALVIKYLKLRGLEVDPRANVYFPRLSELGRLRVKDSILVELPPTKGLIYEGYNLLIDHHDETLVQVFVHDRSFKGVKFKAYVPSVSQLVFLILQDEYSSGPSAFLKLLNAINEIEEGNLRSDLSKALHRAYLLNSPSDSMRFAIIENVLKDCWEEIARWAFEEAKKWYVVEAKVAELLKKASSLSRNVAYFTFNGGEVLEKAAMREAMLALEEEHDIVVALDLRRGRVCRLSIATKNPNIDLRGFYRFLRELKPSIQAGGRRNVGGAQFRELMDLEEALSLVRKGLKNVKL